MTPKTRKSERNDFQTMRRREFFKAFSGAKGIVDVVSARINNLPAHRLVQSDEVY